MKNEPRRPRFGERYGAFVVIGCLALLAVSCVLASVRLWLGVPVLAVVSLGVVALVGWARRKEVAADHAHRASLDEIAPREGGAWRKLVAAAGLDDTAVGPHVRVAARVVPSDSQAVRSHFGGAPELPSDFVWPSHAGAPLAFLGQIDLAEVKGSLGSQLPEDGMLSFFYTADPYVWGFDPKDAGAALVVHHEASTTLVATAPPASVPAHARYPRRTVSFVPYEDLPDVDGAHPFGRVLSDEELDTYLELRAHLSHDDVLGATKLLGYAEPIQSPMELDCQLVTHGLYCGDRSGYEDPRAKELAAGASEWRLLLQVDEAARGMTWGDAGLLYFWIRDADLRARRFDRCWAILQSS